MKEDNIELTIFLSDWILETVLKGLKTLRALRDLNFEEESSLVTQLVTTIMKSSLFQLSFKYELGLENNLNLSNYTLRL